MCMHARTHTHMHTHTCAHTHTHKQYTYLDFRLGKLLGFIYDGCEGGEHLSIHQLVLETGKVLLQSPHTPLREVDVGETVSKVTPLPLCPGVERNRETYHLCLVSIS